MHKPQITEIQVRMDCNGCVHKIKKAFSSINGIYDLYIDFPQQKITVIGWADQENIVKAIKKRRKTATICPLLESVESPSQPTENSSPASNLTQQPPAEAPPDEIPPEQPPPPPEATIATDNNGSQRSESTPGAEDAGEVHHMHRFSSSYANRFDSGNSYDGCWKRYHNNMPVYIQEPSPPMYMTHSHNTYNPSSYVTEYEYVRSARMEYYSGDYESGNANITSIFSDENPNACRII